MNQQWWILHFSLQLSTKCNLRQWKLLSLVCKFNLWDCVWVIMVQTVVLRIKWTIYVDFLTLGSMHTLQAKILKGSKT